MQDDVKTFGSMTRKDFLRASALGSLAFLAGTKAVLAASGKPVRVGLILPSYDQIRWKSGDQPGFESECKKLGLQGFTVASQMSCGVSFAMALIQSRRSAVRPSTAQSACAAMIWASSPPGAAPI